MTEEIHDVRLHVNGASYDVAVPARRLLSDALRQDCGLTGTHVGCEHGVCGACTILVDGRPMRSCLMFAVSAVDASIHPTDDVHAPASYRRKVARLLVQRALGAALERSGANS